MILPRLLRLLVSIIAPALLSYLRCWAIHCLSAQDMVHCLRPTRLLNPDSAIAFRMPPWLLPPPWPKDLSSSTSKLQVT